MIILLLVRALGLRVSLLSLCEQVGNITDRTAAAAALPSVADKGRLSIRGVPQPSLAMTLKNSLVSGKFL